MNKKLRQLSSIGNWLKTKPVWRTDLNRVVYRIQPRNTKNYIRYKYGVKITNPYIYADKFTCEHCVGGKRKNRKVKRTR